MERAKNIRRCNVCNFLGGFSPFGYNRRTDAQCPTCKSLERHRLFKLWLDRESSIKPETRILHFAPEPAIRNILRTLSDHYVSADLNQHDADLVLDIERIGLPSNSVDLIVCFHVLEHVDDRIALAELGRILAPGGLAVLAVPIVEGWDSTYENKSVTASNERLLHFGQENHLRWYGRDFRQRVKDAGFDINEFVGSGSECASFALIPGERLFLATKPIQNRSNPNHSCPPSKQS